jgi:hypothetical protein
MSCCSALIVKLADKAHWAMLFRVTRDEHAGASWLSADAVMAHKDAAETAAAFIAIVFTHFSSSTPGPERTPKRTTQVDWELGTRLRRARARRPALASGHDEPNR